MESRLLTVFGKQLVRGISTTSSACGKRNFKKFPIFNKRGTRIFKAQQAKNPHPDVPIYSKLLSNTFVFLLLNLDSFLRIPDYGVRPTGYKIGSKFVLVDEMIPEIVVPDLTGFKVITWSITFFYVL